MNQLTKSFVVKCISPGNCRLVYDIKSPQPTVSDYAKKNPAEDWADSIRKLIVPSYSARDLGSIRRAYIDEKIRELP